MCSFPMGFFPGAMLSDGPPLAQESGGLGGGFFYDVWLPERQGVQPTHLAAINKLCADIIKGVFFVSARPHHAFLFMIFFRVIMFS